jgi:hypothetical protein
MVGDPKLDLIWLIPNCVRAPTEISPRFSRGRFEQSPETFWPAWLRTVPLA